LDSVGREVGRDLRHREEGKLRLLDPRSEGDFDPSVTPFAAGRVILGHGDPLGARPARRRVREIWEQSSSAGWGQWTAAARVTASTDHRMVLGFRAAWAAPGEGQHGGAVRFLRCWTDVEDRVAWLRQRVRPSAWCALARMGAAKAVEGEDGAFFEVQPLSWFPGAAQPQPLGTMVGRLATSYAGDSSQACGMHVVPEEGALVWLEAPSVFDRPTILADIRTRSIGRTAFGVYLPAGKEWFHHSTAFNVRSNSKFDPPES
jgi:hypothetical protein